MSDSMIGGVKEVWAVRGERKNGKINMVVPASVAGQQNQGDTSGHF